MEKRDKVIALIDKAIYETNDVEYIADEICSLFNVSTSELERKALMYSYELARKYTNEEGVLKISTDVLKDVAKDYVKHVEHFLNLCSRNMNSDKK